MQDLNAQARLVDPAALHGGPTTTIARSEIEDALRNEEAPELVLDISRAGSERSLAVSWQRPDLEQLLSEATGDRIQLTFDGGGLAEALEDDVEAHSLRQKALVLAVAVTGAAAAAGPATATIVSDTGSPAPTTRTAPPAATDPGTSSGDVAAAAAAVGAGAIAIAGATFVLRSRRRLQAT